MNTYLAKFKGIHPGIILARELKKRGIAQRPFALSLGEHPQTINAITKAKRNLPTSIALKIEEKLGMEEGTLALLQTYFDIQTEKSKIKPITPNLSIIRKSVFWDTDISQIDWDKQKYAVIRRIMERGNALEIKEIKQFYGAALITEVLKQKSAEAYKLNP
ncbi:MAG: helix-turn-helix domain-containing protein [Cytophagaceae bacterium]|nr:helix-turn-helix domain-containing protein [Cytophagaceae bacterium]